MCVSGCLCLSLISSLSDISSVIFGIVFRYRIILKNNLESYKVVFEVLLKGNMSKETINSWYNGRLKITSNICFGKW